MSNDKQPIPGPDQMKPERRFEETGAADDRRKEAEPAPKTENPSIPPRVRPPPD